MASLSERLLEMGVVKVQEMGVQNAPHDVNPIADKEEDDWFPLGYRCNDIPVDGLCDLCNCR